MTEKKQQWRIIDVLNWSKNYLDEKGVESPQIEVEWIMRDVLNCSRLDLYMDHEKPLANKELKQIRSYLKKRVDGRPIQYVLGYTEFYGRKFEVDDSVLIPRPETEIIIEKIIEECKDRENLKILDIGTGSGNIIVTLVKELDNAGGLGIDISKKALEVARKNSKLNETEQNIDFLEMDILSDCPANRLFDIIVSNPPYISEEMYQKLPGYIKDHEPEEALKPGQDPLVFYKRINEIVNYLLKDNGLLALEIGGTYQEKKAKRVFEDNFDQIEVIHDYLGQSRGLLIYP